MRDAKDKTTAELPDLPAYQYKKAERDNQAKRAAALGYKGPKERPRCEICAHVDIQVLNPDAMHEREIRRCKLGSFQVMRGGFCLKYRGECQ